MRQKFLHCNELSLLGLAIKEREAMSVHLSIYYHFKWFEGIQELEHLPDPSTQGYRYKSLET